jgi:hypothetical protein
MKDFQGNSFHVGCKIVRAVGDGILAISVVTKIENGKLYLNDSKIAIRYPSRLLIIEQDPLYKMIKKYENIK